MSARRGTLIAVIAIAIVGVLSAPWLLKLLRASPLPITWVYLPVIVVLVFLVRLFAVGLPARVKQHRGVIYTWGFFSVCGLFCVTCGSASALYALVIDKLDPAAFVVLAFGLGIQAAGELTKKQFRASITAVSPPG